MIVNEQTDDNGTFLLIERSGKVYRTKSFTTLASLYNALPLKIYNLETNKTFAILGLSNNGRYQLEIE